MQMSKRASTLFAAATAVSGLCCSPPNAKAVVTSWNVSNGTWNVASNWSNGVPTSTDDAVFPKNLFGTVLLTSTAAPRSLQVNNGDFEILPSPGATLAPTQFMSIGTLSASQATFGLPSPVGGISVSNLYIGATGAAGSLNISDGGHLITTSLARIAQG